MVYVLCYYVGDSKRYVWVKITECGEILNGRRYPLKLKGAVYKSYVRPAILYGSETWSLGVNGMGILRRAEVPW